MTKIMGVLNVTPDSFSGDGVGRSVEHAVQQARCIVAEGADILDIGGESTRPGAEPVTVEEELERVVPVVAALRRSLGEDFPISVDTYKSQVAQDALAAGATMINSLGGFTLDPNLAEVMVRWNCPLIVYHSSRHVPSSSGASISALLRFFESQIAAGEARGMRRTQFWIDPGLGFGKRWDWSVEILRHLSAFTEMHLPIVVGVSRKQHLGVVLQQALGLEHVPDVNDRLEAALAETAVAILGGASVIRTHDVRQTKRFVAAFDFVR